MTNVDDPSKSSDKSIPDEPETKNEVSKDVTGTQNNTSDFDLNKRTLSSKLVMSPAVGRIPIAQVEEESDYSIHSNS